MEQAGMVLFSEGDEKAKVLESKGMTIVFFGWEGAVQGFLAFGDSVKRGAKETVQRLREKGIETWLVSGDSEKTTQAIASELDIHNVVGAALPKDKMELVKKLQEEGHRVGMIGDGFNDAAALTQADVGVAIGARVNLAQEASDINLLDEGIEKVLDLFCLSALTGRIVRQNLVFAFLYNSFGIPLAMAGLLNPLIAVFAMFASSLTVIVNTLRIQWAFGTRMIHH